MTNIWGYRDDLSTAGDLAGFDVEARDGHIGKIDESSSQAGDASLVVDTGFWIFGKKRLIPAGVVERVDASDRKVYVSMTKDQVKDAPDWSEDWRGDDTARASHGDYYTPYGW